MPVPPAAESGFRQLSLQLGAEQEHARAQFSRFVNDEIAPHAGAWDRDACTPPAVMASVSRQGYLGSIVPRAYGGAGHDWVTFGLLNEEIGRGCSSIRSLITVHSMVCAALLHWGTRQQRTSWLPRLARGDAVAAFALSEPNVGSDAASIETVARQVAGEYRITGSKRWTTYGQRADVFLVFARAESGPVALLVQRDAPGLQIRPLQGMTGTRAAQLADLEFADTPVSAHARLGGPGFGVMIALAALEVGRLSVAFGCSGILRACLETSRSFATERQQFGVVLGEHQLIRRMITDMTVSARAAHWLCLRAAWSRDVGDPDASTETAIAKYFASTAAVRAALDACQLQGARGCTDSAPCERFLRDARVAEVIEGSTQIQQITIAAQELAEAHRPQSPSRRAQQAAAPATLSSGE